MRNRWFHRPLLHTAGGPQKRASWLELFYDLIFVAASIQLGEALATGVDDGEGPLAIVSFGAHYTPLWVAWVGFTFYQNRFDVDDFTHRVLVFLQMGAVAALAVAAPLAMSWDHPDPRPFELAYAAAQLIVGVMYARAWKHQEEARDYSLYWGGIFTLGGLIWLVAAFVPMPWNYLMWAVSVVLVLASPLHPRNRAMAEEYPIDQEHLSERYGLLTIIVLGESFVKVLAYLVESGHGTELEYLAKGLFSLVLTICLWWIYFDDVAGSRLRPGFGRWVVWVMGHLPLTMAVTAVGVATKYAVKLDLTATPSSAYRWVIAITLAMALACVALIDAITERRNNDLSDAWRVRVRLASAGLVLLLGAAGSGMSGFVFLGLLAALMLGQVVVDMTVAPFEEVAEEAPVVTTAELARRAAATGAARPRVDAARLGQAVRRGVPNELRRDLYFFLIEGSWTRLLITFVAGFLLLNVVFAGLILLEDDGVAGVATFGEAFAFSVQTMATIGYGVMAPTSSWAHTVVTIEAIVGMLIVALATGLMFAKASRPVARVLFARRPVITLWNGQPTLMLRLGNARGNEVVDTKVTVCVMKDEITSEGHHLRTLLDLPLVRARSPLFMLGFTVRHVIDEASPLSDVDWSAPGQTLHGIIVVMRGHDGTYAQEIHARALYDAEDVAVGHCYVDMVGRLPDGRTLVEFDLLDAVEPDGTADEIMARLAPAPR